MTTTIYIVERPKRHQARQYNPGYTESSPEALEGWILGGGVAETVSVTADAQGFSITTHTDIDGDQTISGVVGDWILMKYNDAYPQKMTDSELMFHYEVS